MRIWPARFPRAAIAKAFLLVASLLLPWQALAQVVPDHQVPRTASAPKIDGILDDQAWQIPPMPTGQWASYNPNRGDVMPDVYKTDVRITYDDRNIYFAFHCFDNEPDRIRTTVSRRDNSFNDDWIAISLDSAGTGQSAYHLFSNPSASQMDALNTSASGEQFDADMVWFSAARTTPDGYIVELEIPLQTLRFAGGGAVRMGLVFFRKVSRIGFSYAWPEMLPGQWVFDRPSHIVFSDLRPRRLMELLPSATYGINQERETADRWAGAVDKFNFGITLDGTINPDFSQVESDAFQVQVNQRFPIFFSEKRPFFMEGMGLFNIAGTGNGDGNMRTAVHTREIVDPIYGSKLTGTAGKTTFGVLNAVDDSPRPPFDIAGEPISVPNKVTTVGRATYALRRSDYAGAIFTHTQHDGERNLTAGGDISVRPSSAQSVSATFLATHTSDRENLDSHGNAAQVSYEYNTRRWTFSSQGEHYDRGFNMDTAFYNRTGFTSLWSFGEVSVYPKSTWLQRVHPFYFAKVGHDDIQGGGEDFLNTGLRFNVTRQGFFNFSTQRGHETWQGTKYRVGSNFQFFGNMQVLRWLFLSANYGHGPAIFYDDVDHFQGRSRYASAETTIQPNQHLSLNLEYNDVRFTRPSNGELVYDVDIINTRTTYQFDKHFLVRLLTRYDSSTRRVLTDFLASYEFVPGTVFHAGYGSLYEKGFGSVEPVPAMNAPVPLEEPYRAVNRGLFLKTSYLWRF
jgi:hypothetical protein